MEQLNHSFGIQPQAGVQPPDSSQPSTEGEFSSKPSIEHARERINTILDDFTTNISSTAQMKGMTLSESIFSVLDTVSSEEQRKILFEAESDNKNTLNQLKFSDLSEIHKVHLIWMASNTSETIEDLLNSMGNERELIVSYAELVKEVKSKLENAEATEIVSIIDLYANSLPIEARLELLAEAIAEKQIRLAELELPRDQLLNLAQHLSYVRGFCKT